MKTGLPEKWLLLTSVVLFFVALAGTYAVVQKSEQLQELEAKTADVSVELEWMKTRLAEPVPPLDMVAMSRAVPADWNLPYVLSDVTMALNRHGLTIHSLTVGEPVSAVESGGEEPEEAEETETLEDMATEASASAEMRFGPQPPSSLAGIRTLPVVLEVSGPIGGTLALLDELHQWARLIWLTGLELEAEVADELPELRVYLNVYAGAPWEAAELKQTWPFSVQPANNAQAFGP